MTPDISIVAWAGLLGAVLFAGVLRGFTGFGFALAAVPLASLALPPARVVPVVLLLQLAIGARDCVRERHLTDRASVLSLVGGCLLGTPVGVAALALLPGAAVRLALGAIVLVAVVATYRGPGRPQPRRSWLALLAGAASGLCNGLAAMSGPPAVLYFLAVEPDRAVTRSSLMVYFFFATAIALPGVVAAGLVDRTVLLLAVAGWPVMWLGGRLGTRGFRHASHRSYRLAAAFALLLTALAAIAKGVAGLL